MRALASPCRVAIVKHLGEKGEMTVKDICQCSVVNELSQSAVSQHLRTLLDCGIISRRLEHPKSFYSVQDWPLDRAKQLFTKL